MHLLSMIIAYIFFIAALVCFAVITVFMYLQHEKYKHIPGPARDNFYLGNVPHIMRRSGGKEKLVFPEIVCEWLHQYGSLFVIWVLHRPVALVIDPELVKKVCVQLRAAKPAYLYRIMSAPYGQRVFGRGLVTEVEYAAWQKKRAAMNPAFHKKYLMNVMDAFNASCDSFLTKIDSLSDGNTEVKMVDEFGRITLDVIGKVAFSVEIDAIHNPTSQFTTAIFECLRAITCNMGNYIMLVNYLGPLTRFHPYVRSVAKRAKFLRDYGENVIKARQNAIRLGEDTPPDVLAHILDTASSDSSHTMENMVDHFITFFFAGQETTSSLLAFTLYEIIQHPEIGKKIYDEIDTVLGSRHYVTFEDLGKLQYLGQTLKESLRLHPPVASVPKVIEKEVTLGGYLIPAGTVLNIEMYTIHRHPDYWKDPEIFDPDRFPMDRSNDGVTSSSKLIFPFSLGPRNCNGQAMAQFECKVIMARLLQEFRLKILPGQTLALIEAVTVRPKDGVTCTITKR